VRNLGFSMSHESNDVSNRVQNIGPERRQVKHRFVPT